MTDREQERVRQLLSGWRGAVVPVAKPEEVAAGREARVDAIARMIAQAPRQKRSAVRRRWATLALAAGVMALVGSAGVLRFVRHEPALAQATAPTVPSQGRLHFVRGHVVATSGDDTRVVRAGEPWSVTAGDEISTAAGATAVVEFNQGARVDLSSATSLRVEHAADREHVLHVNAGRVDVNVPEGDPSRRSFVVNTPNARIAVHGTIFSVEVAAGQGREAVSRVQVTRGVVSVDSKGKQLVLRAGQAWDSVAVEEPVAVTEPGEATAPPGATRRKVAPREPSAEEPAKSTLAEEVRIYEAGLAARESGDFGEAQRQFEALIEQYPHSQMVQPARIELQAARSGQPGATRRH